MKSIISLLLFCSFLSPTLGQNPVDTLSFWNFQIEPHTKTAKDRSIGLITFWRNKPVHDSVHMVRHQELWTPQISFSIYPLSDSAYCKSQSVKMKMSSSCVGPDVGGDMYLVGNLILLNRDIC